jgi:hypothetical protein
MLTLKFWLLNFDNKPLIEKSMFNFTYLHTHKRTSIILFVMALAIMIASWTCLCIAIISVATSESSKLVQEIEGEALVNSSWWNDITNYAPTHC